MEDYGDGEEGDIMEEYEDGEECNGEDNVDVLDANDEQEIKRLKSLWLKKMERQDQVSQMPRSLVLQLGFRQNADIRVTRQSVDHNKRTCPNAFQDQEMEDPFNVNYPEDAFPSDLNELMNEGDG
ncbi:hypothetical protein M9H77_22961 [Catharanthus roseus]|uniref:Uncharacterized protein n=1 Tax=Catharanthus roseus TaxID=4058 RepID=A0ACC0AVZ8_CATRO|nr:hypothetical protein M9H77_22961 [Catharanthus roseus]